MKTVIVTRVGAVRGLLSDMPQNRRSLPTAPRATDARDDLFGELAA